MARNVQVVDDVDTFAIPRPVNVHIHRLLLLFTTSLIFISQKQKNVAFSLSFLFKKN